jgi:hypothetical protein
MKKQQQILKSLAERERRRERGTTLPLALLLAVKSRPILSSYWEMHRTGHVLLQRIRLETSIQPRFLSSSGGSILGKTEPSLGGAVVTRCCRPKAKHRSFLPGFFTLSQQPLNSGTKTQVHHRLRDSSTSMYNYPQVIHG